ncbi:MAG: TonB-dependent receptor [Armatimonadetes bacterium]|nr:TonB-dependent receptor [Armatimonadota bacterium]
MLFHSRFGHLAKSPLLHCAIVVVGLLTIAEHSASQNSAAGEVRGGVINQATGDPVTGATIVVVGTKLGAYSDVRGTFTIRNVPQGSYTLRVTSVGFTPQELTDVKITAGTTRIDVTLQEVSLRGKEVTVTAKGGSGTENALLAQRKKSSTISDGISIAQMRRSPDATSADALARVTGMSVIGGKSVLVRGTGERYNNAQIDGVSMTSTEPEKRSFSFDLFPSNLLENAVVAKSFTPDLPGDFSGGLVQLSTVDYPDERTIRFAISGGYSNGTSLSGMTLGPRGSSDAFGVDDGARALPSSFPDSLLNTPQFKPAEIAGYARQFNNGYSRTPFTAPPNASYLLSYGDRFNVLGNDLGLVLGLTYRNNYDNSTIVRADSARFEYAGTTSEFTTLWGGMANLSYKLGANHSVGVKSLYTRTADDEFTFLQGMDLYNSIEKKLYGFRYLERDMASGQVVGEHLFPWLGALRAQWRVFGSLSSRNEPDFRRAAFARYDPTDTSVPFIALIPTTAPNIFGAGRFFSELSENLGGAAVDVTLPIGNAKIKVGALTENKARDFAARSFAYVVANEASYLAYSSIDTLFDPSHIGEHQLSMREITAKSDKYNASSHLRSGYVMADVPLDLFDQSFRLIGGARLEDWLLNINTADIRPIHVSTITTDILPSANLIWQATDQMNVRLAWSKTVARPEFREFARFVFYDYTTDALVYGNPNLRRTLVANYDFRYEFFPAFGELLAISIFHKNFEDAIEEVTLSGDTPERTWANASNVVNTGVELEARKSLGFLGKLIENFSASMNYTWLDSRVEVEQTDFITGKNGRRLQGQSPYMVNAGLNYSSDSLGFSASLLYNRFGARITQVARAGQPDFVEQPRDLIDLTVTKTIFSNFELKLAVKDILAQDQVFQQGEKKARVNGKQTSLSLSISARF